MSTNKKQDKNKIDQIIDVISESAESNIDFLKEALSDEGFNYEDLENEGIDFIRSFKRKSIFEKSKQKNKRLLELVNKFKSDKYNYTKQEIITELKGIFSGKLAAAYFQKLESVDEKDLKNIIDETEILKLFEAELKEKNDI